MFFLLMLGTQGYPQAVRVGLCYNPDEKPVKEFRVAALKCVSRVSKIAGDTFRVEARFRACNAVPKYLSFYATPEAILGREEAFSRLVTSASWLAAEQTFLAKKDTKNSSSLSGRNIKWLDIHRLGNAQLYSSPEQVLGLLGDGSQFHYSKEDIKKISELAFAILDIENSTQVITPKEEAIKTGLILYRCILDLGISFILGHEMFHFFADKCVSTSPSQIEAKGTLDLFVKLQSGGKLYRPLTIEHKELLADRCGYRILEKANLAFQKSMNAELHARAAQSSIDLIAGFFFLGSEKEKYTWGVKPEALVLDDYLLPQSRLLLFSSVLHFTEAKYPWAVKICGNTAEATVTFIQKDFTEYPASDGDVPDAILDQLPSGVKMGWETNIWNNTSFVCAP